MNSAWYFVPQHFYCETGGGVFTPDLIETWIAYKRSAEVDYVRLRPHPAEFELYYDI
jgi:glutamine synthetase